MSKSPCTCCRFSCVRPFVTLWTIACQAPLSMGFSRQEYWSNLPFPTPVDLPDPGIEQSSNWQVSSLPPVPPERLPRVCVCVCVCESLSRVPSNVAYQLFCPSDSLGKNTGMYCHAPLQGSNPGIEILKERRVDSLSSQPQGKPLESPLKHLNATKLHNSFSCLHVLFPYLGPRVSKNWVSDGCQVISAEESNTKN